MQSQSPNAPYVGLWARLEGFQPDDLTGLLKDRQAVRIALMRSTIHLVTARDCLALRPLIQPVLDRALKGTFGKRLAGLDIAEVATVGRALVEERPLTFAELGALLGECWPDRDPSALANAVRALTPLIQPPPRGIWGAGGQATHTTAEAWLGAPLDPNPSLDAMLLRYLAAFGPASVRDMQMWSGLTQLRQVFGRLRPQLTVFQNERGVELFDTPDAPRPDPDMSVPPRFLPEWDNLLFSHADRARVISDAHRQRLSATDDGRLPAAILLDGFMVGVWKIARAKGVATLRIQPYRPLTPLERDALAEEGARLLIFAAADTATHAIQFTPED